jgi:hypothetical protein
MDDNNINVNIIQNSDELKGTLFVQLKKNESLNRFCEKHFTNFNAVQYEAIAIRVYYKKDLNITLYALDRVRHERTNYSPEELPVKKFKAKGFHLMDILAVLEEFNFTLTTGNYPVDIMRVINK